MRYCNAWPEACLSDSSNADPKLSNATQENALLTQHKQDAEVLPKSLIESEVQQTVDRLIEKAFEDLPVEKNKSQKKASDTDSEDPQNLKAPMRKQKKTHKNSSSSIHSREMLDSHQASHMPQRDDSKALWISFGSLCVIMMILFLCTYQKIQSLENWLHGYMMSRDT